MPNDSLKVNQNDDGTFKVEWDKQDPNWAFLNELTSEQIEELIQQIVKEDQNGRK
jgi:hypothetical protein